MTDDVHVMPIGDLIEHDYQGCPCGPDTIPVEREDGSAAGRGIHSPT